MKKHRLRGWILSFLGSHINSESLEQDKKDIDKNVKKILKLINDEKEGNPVQIAEAPELAAFIEDFYKCYTHLYERYDHLAGELKKKAQHKDKTDGRSSSSSSSDSESEIFMRNKKTGENMKDETGEQMISVSEHQTLLEQIENERESYKLLQVENVSLKEELDTASQLVTDLNQTLRTIYEVKDSLMLEKQKAEDERKRLGIEYEQLKEEDSKLHVKYGDLKLQLDSAMQHLADLNQSLTAVKEEKDALILESSVALIKMQQAEKNIKDLETEIGSLKDEKSILLSENEGLKLELESANLEVTNINQGLQAASREKDALALEHLEVSSKLQKAEKNIKEYGTEMRLLKDEISELQIGYDSLKLKAEASIMEVTELKQLLTAYNGENDTLNSKNLALLSEVQEAEKTIKESVMEAEQLKGDISKLQADNEDLKRELEAVNQHVADLKQALQETKEQKDALALENSATLNKLKQTENNAEKLENEVHVVQTSLKNQVRGLESRLEEKTDEISTLQKNLEDAKNEASGRNKTLTLHLIELQLELELLRTQESELKNQVERKGLEALNIQNQRDKLEHEFTSRISEQQKMLSEREHHFHELDWNYKQLEDQFHATSEKLLITESNLQKLEEENRQRILDTNDLQLELNLLCTQKSELEHHIERKNNEASETQIQMETLNYELTSKFSDLQRMLKDKEHNFDELNSKYILVNDQFQESCAKLLIVEKKIEEIVDENQKMIESKDETIWKMQMVSQENVEEVETARVEIGKLRAEVSELEENCKELREKLDLVEVEKIEMSREKQGQLQIKDDKIGMLQRTEAEQKQEIERLEVQLCLSNRKLQITETESKEKEDNYLNKYQKLDEECKQKEAFILKSLEKTALLEKELSEIKGMTKFVMKDLESGLSKMELMVHKFEEKYNNILTRVSNWSQELQIAKRLAAAIINEKEDLKKELHDKDEQAGVLREKDKVLEVKVTEVEGEKEELAKRVLHFNKKLEELEKTVEEKEAMIMDREEEKREAIRQLCLWINYYRENDDHLRQRLSSMLKRNR